MNETKDFHKLSPAEKMERWRRGEDAKEQDRRDRAKEAAEKGIDADWVPGPRTSPLAQTVKGSLFNESGMMVNWQQKIASDARQSETVKPSGKSKERKHSAAKELEARVFIELHKKELIPDQKLAYLVAAGFDLQALGASDEQIARAWEQIDN